MTFNELISRCKPIDISGKEPDIIGALTQDSRKVEQGSVFIAVRGLQVDGHNFIDDAVRRGASLVITEKPFYTAKPVCVFEVNDTRSLVGPLAQAFEGQPAHKLNIIGITGTNGKTTVATLTYQVLQKMGVKISLLGTVEKRINDREVDSRLTTADPVELAADMAKMVKANSTHLVMEVSSHALDQQRVEGIDYQMGVFTNLSHDHLDYHDTLKSYAKSKKKLFDHLQSDCSAIINGDDDRAAYMVMDCSASVIDFSFKKPSDIECRLLANTSDGLKISIGTTQVESPLLGLFNAYNITEAFLICKALGFDEQAIANALTSAAGAKGRLERVERADKDRRRPVILVDYAHTPDALKNVLTTLADIKTDDQKLQVIFGCGGDRDKTKRPEMAQIAEQYADTVTVTSDNPRSENPDAIIDEIMTGFEFPDRVQRMTDRNKAITKVVSSCSDQSMILIAGKGHETYQEIEGQRYEFDDITVAHNALGKRKNHPNGEVA